MVLFVSVSDFPLPAQMQSGNLVRNQEPQPQTAPPTAQPPRGIHRSLGPLLGAGRAPALPPLSLLTSFGMEGKCHGTQWFQSRGQAPAGQKQTVISKENAG